MPLSHLADVQLVVLPLQQGSFETISAWAAILESMTLTVAEKCRQKDPGYQDGAERMLNDLFGFSEGLSPTSYSG